MKTCLSILLICVIDLHSAAAQSLRYPLVHPYTSLSAYSSRQPEPLSFSGNQAALMQIRSAGMAVYGERRFMLKETASYIIGAAIPTRLGNLGVQLNYAGFKNFTEHKIGLAYARSLGKKTDIGIQFNYYGYRVPAYGSSSSVNFEIAAMIHLTGKLNAGIHVYNPVGVTSTSSGREKEKLASVYKAGFGYDASADFFISAEIIREEDKPVNIIAGFQYRFAKQFFVRAGFMSDQGTVFAGAGLGWKNLQLHIAANYHPQLGFSPGILLIMNFKTAAK